MFDCTCLYGRLYGIIICVFSHQVYKKMIGSPEHKGKADYYTKKEHELHGVDTLCGYSSSCKPGFLQRFATPKVYLVIISLCSIVQG